MGVSLFYLVALLPIAIGAALWYFDKEIVWWEWLIGCGTALLLAAIFHGVSLWGMTDDTETWSSYVIKATHHPEWVEKYYVTVEHGSGKHKYTTREPRWTTHHEFWDADDQYVSHEITQTFFEEIRRNFKNFVTEQPYKSGFDSGDRNIYVTYNKTGFIYPTTSLHHWANKVKAAPTVFTFAHVSTNIAVYAWPENPDWRISERLLGTASVLFSQLEFDRMNARLGPTKKVNVIFVGFSDKDSTYGQYQEAKWLGGKKNDLVVAFGGMTKNHPATWVHVFGWSESFLAKRNIETLFTKYPASPELLTLVEQEVNARYQIKEWKKFDYITVEPPTWSYVVFFIVLTLVQGILYFVFHTNQESKDRFGSYARSWYIKRY